MLIEYSVLLGYAVGYIASTETYVIYSFVMPDSTVKSIVDYLLELHPQSCVTLVGDAQRAKGLINAPDWIKAIDEMS